MDNSTFSVFTHDDLNNTNLIIDNTAPTITLNGGAQLIIFVGASYVDQNATASDTSYGNMTIIGVGTVDTQVHGIYTLNYTAPADYAGNVGPNVTRTVTVVDELINITSLSILSSSGNNFARAGQNITLVLETDGSDITNTTLPA